MIQDIILKKHPRQLHIPISHMQRVFLEHDVEMEVHRKDRQQL